MEMMEWGEQKAEGINIAPDIEDNKKQTLEQISRFFAKGDYTNAAQELVKLQYLCRL
jgi:hypothetical protein